MGETERETEMGETERDERSTARFTVPLPLPPLSPPSHLSLLPRFSIAIVCFALVVGRATWAWEWPCTLWLATKQPSCLNPGRRKQLDVRRCRVYVCVNVCVRECVCVCKGNPPKTKFSRFHTFMTCCLVVVLLLSSFLALLLARALIRVRWILHCDYGDGHCV